VNPMVGLESVGPSIVPPQLLSLIRLRGQAENIELQTTVSDLQNYSLLTGSPS
jgi:hypothetical protein